MDKVNFCNGGIDSNRNPIGVKIILHSIKKKLPLVGLCSHLGVPDRGWKRCNSAHDSRIATKCRTSFRSCYVQWHPNRGAILPWSSPEKLWQNHAKKIAGRLLTKRSFFGRQVSHHFVRSILPRFVRRRSWQKSHYDLGVIKINWIKSVSRICVNFGNRSKIGTHLGSNWK